MISSGNDSPSPNGALRAMRPWLVPVALLATAWVCVADPFGYVDPVTAPVAVPAWATDPTPVRQPTLRPETTIGVYRFRCNECHRLLPSPTETDRPLTQHRQIQLQHGINNRCFNCHLRTDRDAFADYRGGPIAYDQPQLLCAKCHGPVYRDWLHGVHGRTNGFWNERLGPRDRRKCIECHDPHAPAFRALVPAPGPRTLRMGEPEGVETHEKDRRNPLLIYRSPTGES